MSEKRPKTILTDQDPGMSKAIAVVMPESYHRLCVYHLGNNAYKHLSHLYKSSESFGYDFNKLIYEYENEQEFLKAWETMLETYGLRENKWLKGTFAVREKWSMAYGRKTFSAGLRTTQLSESFNKDLKMHLRVTLDVVRFFKHYENALMDKRHNELDAIYDMTQRLPNLKVDIPLLKHARAVYTSSMFDKFQDEWVKSLIIVVVECKKEGLNQVYKVKAVEEKRDHEVVANPTSMEVSCSCKNFEFQGILCNHILKILDLMNVKEEIPSRYIFKRWTKDPMGEGFMDIDKGEQEENPKLKVCSRYRILCSTFVRIATMACESEVGSKLAAKYANELMVKLKETSLGQACGESATCTNIEVEVINPSNTKAIKAEGLKKKQSAHKGTRRLKGCLEKTSKKKGLEKPTKKKDLNKPSRKRKDPEKPLECENSHQMLVSPNPTSSNLRDDGMQEISPDWNTGANVEFRIKNITSSLQEKEDPLLDGIQ
ncbi:Zinc finger, PMZ-type [Corchorus olitorius]|uniref:Protein FAR1-RELATED SEQUENCE n=1 Tax=Corchorus olitorius TaxID=93759 RepID=A0A1R3IWK8_9ROSI|nr:Zinc finger, PMZ-type [Corchorus olitorius]